MFRNILLLLAFTFPSCLFAGEYEFHHEHVLGTSLTLCVRGVSPELARRVETQTLEEIARLDAIFSRYRDDSELSRWLTAPPHQAMELSPELTRVLERSEWLRRQTEGAFDIRIAAITELWKAAARLGQAPSAEQRSALSQSLAGPAVAFENGRVVRLSSHPVSLDAIAKGYIIDRVCQRVAQQLQPDAGVTINIGGDLRTIGVGRQRIHITDPDNAGENAASLADFVISSPLAVATSGNYRRRHKVGDRSFAHLFDPRSALPIESVASVSVMAPTAMDADAFATAAAVMPVERAIEWMDSMPRCACLIVTSNGLIRSSSAWPVAESTGESLSVDLRASSSPARLLVADAQEVKPGLHVWFKLERPGGGSYRRPYLAVWLEDTDGFPVKTAVLWMQTEQPGPRWHRDLTRWYRNDRMRKIVEKTNLIETISGATRGPGEYETHFDGTDNDGEPLPAGNYVLCLEAARENGTYKIIRERVHWGSDAIEKQELKGNLEISAASYQFSPVVK